MAKFCTYCGKQLEDGEVCSCTTQTAQAPNQQPAQAAPTMQQQTTPYAQAPTQYAPNPTAQAIGSGFKSLLTIVNKPMETLSSFVNAANFIVALILIGAQALVAGFFTLAAMSDLGEMINLGKMFFLTLLFSLVLSAVLYGSLFLFTIIFKGKTDAKTLLTVVAIRSVIVIPFMVLGLLLGFASIGLGIGLFLLGEVFAFSYLYHALKVATGLPDNKLMFIIPLAIVVVVIVYAIIMQGVAKDIVKDALGGLLGGLSGLSSLY